MSTPLAILALLSVGIIIGHTLTKRFKPSPIPDRTTELEALQKECNNLKMVCSLMQSTLTPLLHHLMHSGHHKTNIFETYHAEGMFTGNARPCDQGSTSPVHLKDVSVRAIGQNLPGFSGSVLFINTENSAAYFTPAPIFEEGFKQVSYG